MLATESFREALTTAGEAFLNSQPLIQIMQLKTNQPMNSVVAFACLVFSSHFQLDFSTMIRQGVKRTNHETMSVLHNCMTPGDGALTIPFLDVYVLTSASLTMLGLTLAVFLFLDSHLPGEAKDIFFYKSEN